MEKQKIAFFITIGFFVGLLVGILVGGSGKDKETIVEVRVEDELTEWQIMELGIIKTESEFNPLAEGKASDLGIFQITPIYVKEANRILGEEKYLPSEALNPQKSVEMFNIVQNHHNPSHDIDKAIVSHNPTATNAYWIKVKKNMDWVRNYEQLREIVK